MNSRAELVSAVLGHIVEVSRELRVSGHQPFGARTLSPRQLELLFVVARRGKPITAGNLATALGVTPGAVSQAMESLQADGLIRIDVHPNDGRSRLVSLTPAAHEEVTAFEAGMAQWMSPKMNSLSVDELRTLSSLLSRIASDNS